MHEYYENEIKRLEQEAEKAREHDENKKMAASIYDMYRSYVEVGFTEEQAWEVFIALLKSVNN